MSTDPHLEPKRGLQTSILAYVLFGTVVALIYVLFGTGLTVVGVLRSRTPRGRSHHRCNGVTRSAMGNRS
eukprot:574154-Alexandrium_andersonii.AAC.1